MALSLRSWSIVIENSLQLDTPPVKAREDVREEEKVSVPDKEVEEGNMGRLIKPAASCQENNAIKSKNLAKKYINYFF